MAQPSHGCGRAEMAMAMVVVAAAPALLLPPPKSGSSGGSSVHMVDSDRSLALQHLAAPDFAECVTFHQMDIYSEGFAAWLCATCGAARRGGATPVVVGLHLCGSLSTRLVELFGAVGEMAVLVLSPCCLPRKDHTARDLCREKGLDPYTHWCQVVFDSLPVSEAVWKDMAVDENVLSAKNTVMWTAKRAEAAAGGGE